MISVIYYKYQARYQMQQFFLFLHEECLRRTCASRRKHSSSCITHIYNMRVLYDRQTTERAHSARGRIVFNFRFLIFFYRWVSMCALVISVLNIERSYELLYVERAMYVIWFSMNFKYREKPGKDTGMGIFWMHLVRFNFVTKFLV